jgi:hypothetical protein
MERTKSSNMQVGRPLIDLFNRQDHHQWSAR